MISLCYVRIIIVSFGLFQYRQIYRMQGTELFGGILETREADVSFMTDDYKQRLKKTQQSRSDNDAKFMKFSSDRRLKELAAARKVVRAPVSQPVQDMSGTELYAWKTRAAQVHLMTDDFKQHLKTMQPFADEAPQSAPTNDNVTPNLAEVDHASPIHLDCATLAKNWQSGSKYEKFKQELRNRKWLRWRKEEPTEGEFGCTRRRREENFWFKRFSRYPKNSFVD